MKLHFFRCS